MIHRSTGHDTSNEPRDELGRWAASGSSKEQDLVARYLPGATPAQVRSAFRGEFGNKQLFTKVSSIEETIREGETSQENRPCLAVGGEIFYGARRVGMFKRFFFNHDGKTPEVYHDLVEIEEAKFTHTGFGPEFIENSENWYRQWGIKEVRLSANISVGSYAWAKLGFDFADEATRQRVLDAFATWTKKRGSPLNTTKIHALKHAWDVAACDDGHSYHVQRSNLNGEPEIDGDYPIGKAFLLEVHPVWSGVQQLDQKSTSQRLFRRYLRLHNKGRA